MKNTTGYFTGTGTTRAITRDRATGPGDTKLISLPRVMHQRGEWTLSGIRDRFRRSPVL
jgi:hypothetical protein